MDPKKGVVYTMIKKDELVQIKGRTIYFPKVILDRNELYDLYVYGHVPPGFLYQIVENTEDLDWVIETYKKDRPTKQEGLAYLTKKWMGHKDRVKEDLYAFSRGDLDLIDLSVKYGLYYYNIRAVFKKVLPDVDVDRYWKAHKKAVQKRTCQALYGTDSALKDPEVHAKFRATMQDRYGVDNPMQVEMFKNKLVATMMDRYGVKTNLLLGDSRHSFSRQIYGLLIKDDAWSQVIDKLAGDLEIPLWDLPTALPIRKGDFASSRRIGDSLERLFGTWLDLTGEKIVYPDNYFFSLPGTFSRTFLRHYETAGYFNLPDDFMTYKSRYEARVAGFLDELGVSYEKNVKGLLWGMEIDFYIPSRKLGIEVNPISSHNANRYAIKRATYGQVMDENYHHRKYLMAKEAGITLIQLYEYDLEPVQFKRKIEPFLRQKVLGYSKKIYGRNTAVYEALGTDRKACIDFLNKYHLQGASKASRYLAMVYEGDLVGVASFRNKTGHTELKRLCFKSDVQVLGGLSKFISHYFKLDPACQEIRSYSDNNIGNGQAYARAGGEYLSESKNSLKFISPTNGLDKYSWQIATKWSARGGVLSQYVQGLEGQEAIDKFIELDLPHRYDGGKGYDRLYTAGSKLWRFSRQK